MLLTFVTLLCGLRGGPDSCLDHLQDHFRIKSITACRQLSGDALADYLEQLGKHRELNALLEVYKSGIPGAEYALTVYVRALDGGDAVQFCKSLAPGSPEWEDAFWGLSVHRDRRVLRYVREIHRTGPVWVRALCYDVAGNGGWNVLIHEARQDRNSTRPSGRPFLTLGDHARLYLQAVDRSDSQDSTDPVSK
jgi:hypothetical protein